MNLRNVFLSMSAIFAVSSSVYGVEHHTLRFLHPRHRTPMKAEALTIAPDGSELAVSVDQGIVYFVGVADGQQISQITARPFVMRYSRNSSRLMMVQPKEAYVIDTKTRRRATVDTRETPGYLGLSIVERNGKLLVDRLDDGGPAAECGELQVSDEVFQLAESKSGHWKTAVGMTADELMNQLRGPVNTFVRLQVLHKGAPKPDTVLLMRRGGRNVGGKWTFDPPAVQAIDENLVFFARGDRHTFVSAYDGSPVGSFAPESIHLQGQFAISSDQKSFAAISTMRDNSDFFGIEIHDLQSLERRHFFRFERSSYFDIAYSTGGQELFVASRDRVDVLDAATGAFRRSYRLDGEVTTSFDVDTPKRNRVTFNGSVGNAVAGAAYDRNGDFGWVPPHKLSSIAVSSTLLATASPLGQIDVWDLKTGASLKSIPLGPNATYGWQREVGFLQFSDDGHWLVFYVNGVLSIVEVRDLVSNTASK